jgi:hypothetical protein
MAVAALWEADGCSIAALPSSDDDFKAPGGVDSVFATAAAAEFPAAGFAMLFGSAGFSADTAGEVACCLFAPGPIGAGFGGC